VADARNKRVPDRRAEPLVAEVTAAHPPASPGRREVRIMYAAQTDVAPPTFVFFTNVATSFHFSYERFLMNKLRESFGWKARRSGSRSGGATRANARDGEELVVCGLWFVVRSLRCGSRFSRFAVLARTDPESPLSASRFPIPDP
jgi:hypothetical protein